MSTSSTGNSEQEKIREQSLSGLPIEFKIALLKELGYETDGKYIRAAGSEEKLLDRYSDTPITVDNMVIFPGRSPPVILEDSPLSIACYLDEYGDIL